MAGRSKNLWMPIVASQIANISALPATTSGSSESVITTRSVATAAPAAATNDEPVQNRAGANAG